MSGSGVDVVIVNWNSGAYLAQCVASVDVHGDAEVKRIVVVDNASTDRSDDVTTARVPLEIVRNASNVGFGAACNIGARRGRAEFDSVPESGRVGRSNIDCDVRRRIANAPRRVGGRGAVVRQRRDGTAHVLSRADCGRG